MMLSLSFFGGSKSAEGGSISLTGFEPGGLGHPNVEVVLKLWTPYFLPNFLLC